MSTLDLADLAGRCCALARDAGAAIMQIYAGEFAVERKDDDSPLTAADLAAHRVIVNGLRALNPQIPILSEESAEQADWQERQSWSRYWLVDPLDGTREFIKRNGEFTVNIALIDDHEPVLGVVYAPALDELYWAWRGGHANFSTSSQSGSLRTRPRATSLLVLQSKKRTSSRIVPARFHLDGRIVNEAPVSIDRKDGRVDLQQSRCARHFADHHRIIDDVEMRPPAINVGGIGDIGSVGEHDVFFRGKSKKLALGERVEVSRVADHPREHCAEITRVQ